MNQGARDRYVMCSPLCYTWLNPDVLSTTVERKKSTYTVKEPLTFKKWIFRNGKPVCDDYHFDMDGNRTTNFSGDKH
jgi:hypothetical protein